MFEVDKMRRRRGAFEVRGGVNRRLKWEDHIMSGVVVC